MGGTVARVVKGVSVASVLLNTVGVGIDIAFLGHAIYDLFQVSKIETRRDAQTNISVEIDPDDLSAQTIVLVQLMRRINEICSEA